MLDIVDSLPLHARVLDLGAREGSFASARSDLCIVRADLDAPSGKQAGNYVRGDAARLPFQARCFDAIISNHSLEHFTELNRTVAEIGRVARPDSVLYVAVPDANTLTDRIYRWLGKGGGHVNAFRSPEQVIRLIEQGTGLAHRSTTVLYTSLCFLNAHNLTGRRQRKLALFAFGNEGFLVWFNWILRRIDRAIATRLAVYGWAFRFGNTSPAPAGQSWINVCVRCGSGFAEAFLRREGAVARGPGIDRYKCPNCGARNLLTPENPALP
jgi:SAM-dependent methyltransferase